MRTLICTALVVFFSSTLRAQDEVELLLLNPIPIEYFESDYRFSFNRPFPIIPYQEPAPETGVIPAVQEERRNFLFQLGTELLLIRRVKDSPFFLFGAIEFHVELEFIGMQVDMEGIRAGFYYLPARARNQKAITLR